MDPKISWALRHIELFPIEINKAPPELLLRIPGVGSVSAVRIARQRRIAAVKYDDLKKIGVVLKRARFFLTCSGKYYGGKGPDPVYIKDRLLRPEDIRSGLAEKGGPPQISMFDGGLLPAGVPAAVPVTPAVARGTPAVAPACPPETDVPAAFAPEGRA
jgi:predicted DNA-binding helix-hairpin-helix protein